MPRRFFIPLSILLGCLFAVPSLFVHSQVNTNGQPRIELSNPYPAPGERFEATVINPRGGTAQGDLVWRINGQADPNLTNQRTATLQAGALSEPSQITVHRGEQRLAQAIILPVYVDIGINTNSYVPNWYAGRSQPSPGSDVTLTAHVTESTFRDPDNYTYTWRINNTVIEGGPRRGLHTVTTTVPNRGEMSVQVTIGRDGVQLAQEDVTVPVSQTDVAFYEVSSLYGVRPHMLSNDNSTQNFAATIEGAPYFLPNQVLTNNAEVRWRVNGQTVRGDDNPLRVTLGSNQLQTRANVDMLVRNAEYVLYPAQGQVRISN